MKLHRTLPLILAFCSISFAAEKKPNILVIYTDDHGWADLGVQGVDADIKTPNLDQLARDGIRFSRGYVSAPQCVPSRAGVITGRYQEKFGVEDNLKGPLPPEETTIAERLKAVGYRTGMSGKWHLDIGGKGAQQAANLHRESMPGAQGFDEYWRGEMRQYYASHDLKGRPFPDAPHLVSDNRFRVVVQTEAALSFLNRRVAQPEQPWFFYLAWYAPHVPLESPEPWFSRTPANLPTERRQALSMIAAMDDGLGQIRAKLKAMKQDQNTLIFCVGDNGAPLKPGAWNGSLNKPLIGEKGMLTDGGIRTPFVAAWPGTLPAGQTYDHPVINLDIAATAVAQAGAPSDDHLDGVNLMPYLTGQKKDAPHDSLFWRWRSQAAVLEYPWKLIQLGEKERFLFNVTEPTGELAKNDQLSRHPEIADRLASKLKTWSDTLRPPGAPEAENGQDDYFYNTHVKLDPKALEARDKKVEAGRSAAAGRAKAPANSDATIQGWVCRNGSLTQQADGLLVRGEPGARGTPFLARTRLDLTGPVEVQIKARSNRGGKALLSWRTETDRDFLPANTTPVEWPASEAWQELKVTAPSKAKIIHFRLSLPEDADEVEIASIRLTPATGIALPFNFENARAK